MDKYQTHQTQNPFGWRIHSTHVCSLKSVTTEEMTSHRIDKWFCEKDFRLLGWQSKLLIQLRSFNNEDYIQIYIYISCDSNNCSPQIAVYECLLYAKMTTDRSHCISVAWSWKNCHGSMISFHSPCMDTSIYDRDWNGNKCIVSPENTAILCMMPMWLFG